jgi:hypothetical protein
VTTPRLAARIEVSALIRRIEGQGGHGIVIARGDPDGGSILLLLAERGVPKTLLERVLGPDGAYRWQRTGPQDSVIPCHFDNYIQRRRGFDSDLWVVELDTAGVERFADEMIAVG